MHKLTEEQVACASKKGRYGDGGGLWLQVSPSGTKAWLFRYMLDGKARQMGLGSVDAVSLEQARQKALRARQCLAMKKDPMMEKEFVSDIGLRSARLTLVEYEAGEPPIRFIRRKDVELATALPTSTLYELMEQGAFPRPVRISTGRVAWVQSEVNEWMEERIRIRDANH